MKAHYVCGGHGAWRPSFGKTFKVPKGITVYFYVPHGSSLPNKEGQLIDQYINEGPGAVAHVGPPLRAGQDCYPYHLYNNRGGGYLNLQMSSSASPNYITNKGPGGRSLENILLMISKSCDDAHVHWSACRALEKDSDPEDFAEDKPRAVDMKNMREKDWGDISTQLNIVLSRPAGTVGTLSSDTTNLTPQDAKKHGLFCKMKHFFGKK